MFVFTSNHQTFCSLRVQGQTCYGCINHDKVIGLCSDLLMLHLPSIRKTSFRLSQESNPGHLVFFLWMDPIFSSLLLLAVFWPKLAFWPNFWPDFSLLKILPKMAKLIEKSNQSKIWQLVGLCKKLFTGLLYYINLSFYRAGIEPGSSAIAVRPER